MHNSSFPVVRTYPRKDSRIGPPEDYKLGELIAHMAQSTKLPPKNNTHQSYQTRDANTAITASKILEHIFELKIVFRAKPKRDKIKKQ